VTHAAAPHRIAWKQTSDELLRGYTREASFDGDAAGTAKGRKAPGSPTATPAFVA
jgi:hypothetical protein